MEEPNTDARAEKLHHALRSFCDLVDECVAYANSRSMFREGGKAWRRLDTPANRVWLTEYGERFEGVRAEALAALDEADGAGLLTESQLNVTRRTVQGYIVGRWGTQRTPDGCSAPSFKVHAGRATQEEIDLLARTLGDLRELLWPTLGGPEQSWAPPAPAVSLVVRKLSKAELRVPDWLRCHTFPKFIADGVEQIYFDAEFPLCTQHVFAMVRLAQGAVVRILSVRQDRAADSSQVDPSVFVQNVIFALRCARDEVLKVAPPGHMSVVNTRLDRLIDVTKRALDAFMSQPVDRILCMNPACEQGGHHLLPGPWAEAIRESGEACEDVIRLVGLIGDPEPSVALHRLSESDLAELIRVALEAIAAKSGEGKRNGNAEKTCGEGKRAQPKPLTPCVRKAGESMEELQRKRDDLLPETGRTPPKECWQWVKENFYEAKQCPDYPTWARYLRAYYSEGQTKLPGRRVEATRSMMNARDRTTG